MEQKSKSKSFKTRPFIATGMFISGLCLPFSGWMNHRLQLESMTVERHFWMSVHNISAILFVIFVVFHVVYNWKTMVKYLRNIRKTAPSKEAITAFVLVVVLSGLYSLHAFIV